MRAKVDRQSFDELKPGVEAALALLDWYEQLQTELITLVDRLAKAAPPLPPDELTMICQAVDCCVLMENQARQSARGPPPTRASVARGRYTHGVPPPDGRLPPKPRHTRHFRSAVHLRGEKTDTRAVGPRSRPLSPPPPLVRAQFSGWSACVNRFSWFKRTFGMLRKDVAGEVNVEKLNKDINRFQNLIGSTQFPIGTHMTGPLRDRLKKVHRRRRPARTFPAAPSPRSARPTPTARGLAGERCSKGAAGRGQQARRGGGDGEAEAGAAAAAAATVLNIHGRRRHGARQLQRLQPGLGAQAGAARLQAFPGDGVRATARDHRRAGRDYEREDAAGGGAAEVSALHHQHGGQVGRRLGRRRGHLLHHRLIP